MQQSDFLKTSQNIILENRKKLVISGVKDIDNFDNNIISALTSLGHLTIKGTELKINNFSVETGDASIVGNINSLVYDNLRDKSFWAKIIK